MKTLSAIPAAAQLAVPATGAIGKKHAETDIVSDQPQIAGAETRSRAGSYVVSPGSSPA
jgi:hypothetical protein